jgi:hypothetical protein
MGSSFSSVDSAYLYVRDLSDKDVGAFMAQDEVQSSKLNIWCVKDPSRIKLLNRMLKPDDLNRLCSLVLADFSEPWELMNCLNKWSSSLRELVTHLLPQLPYSQQEALKTKLKTEVLTYEEPELDAEGKLIKKVHIKEEDEQD